MDIIDKNLYKPKSYKDQKVSDAYKTVFKDNMAVDIVIRDLIKFTQYNSKMVNTDKDLMYHVLGQRSVIERIKDMLNMVEGDEKQMIASVEEMEKENNDE